MDKIEQSGRATWTSLAQAAALGLALGMCSCGAATGSANTPEVDLGQGDPQGVRAIAAGESGERPSYGDAAHRKAAPLPLAFQALGHACPTQPDPTQTVQIICGRDHRISAMMKFAQGSVDALPEPVLRRASIGAFNHAQVHLDGEHLWIASACMMCRVPSETLWIGDLSLVTDAEIGLAQAQMGLPDKPALRDERAWHGALATNAP